MGVARFGVLDGCYVRPGPDKAARPSQARPKALAATGLVVPRMPGGMKESRRQIAGWPPGERRRRSWPASINTAITARASEPGSGTLPLVLPVPGVTLIWP